MKHFRTVLLIALFLIFALQIAYGQPTTGQNWVGIFYNSTDFSTEPVASALYPNGLNVNWGSGKPRDANGVELGAVNEDNFAARFTSTQPFTAGEYTFRILVNDGVRLSIDNIVYLNKFNSRISNDNYGVYTFKANMTAGNHKLRVAFADYTGSAILQVAWVRSDWKPPTNTVTPLPTWDPEITAEPTLAETYTPTPLPTDMIEVLYNGGFEIMSPLQPRQPDGWKAVDVTKDRIKCNTAARTVAFRGQCAYRFNGSQDERSRLIQKPDVSSLYLQTNGDLYMSVQYRTVGVGAWMRIKTIVYHARSYDTMSLIIIGSSPAYKLNRIGPLGLSDDVYKVKFRFYNRSLSGKIFVDDVSLIYKVPDGTIP